MHRERAPVGYNPNHQQRPSENRYSPIRILITEHRRLTRDGYRSLIESDNSFKVVGDASDMNTALSLAETLQPDVILLDINLAKPTLSRSINILRDKAPTSKTLLVAANEWIRDTSTLMGQVRGVGFVLTESTGEELIMGLHEIYENGFYFAAGATRKLFAAGNQDQDSTFLARRVLTRREYEVLRLISNGKPNREIATELGISVRTVEAHKARMIANLGLSNTTELLRFAMETVQ